MSGIITMCLSEVYFASVSNCCKFIFQMFKWDHLSLIQIVEAVNLMEFYIAC